MMTFVASNAPQTLCRVGCNALLWISACSLVCMFVREILSVLALCLRESICVLCMVRYHVMMMLW